MPARRVVRSAALAFALVGLAVGCGASTRSRTPELSRLPLLPGAKVLAGVRRCNEGASAYCALALVVTDRRYASSHDLVLAERDLLRSEGWIGASPYTGVEVADESPHHSLRVTYATAQDDLQGWDLGWIQRPWPVVTALDRAMFDRTSTISMLLEIGSQ